MLQVDAKQNNANGYKFNVKKQQHYNKVIQS
jgi:hypothetical protein